MDNDRAAPSGWYGDVLADLAQALRRDGLRESAEVLDDAAVVLAQEQQALERRREKRPKVSLRIVSN